MSSPEYFAAHFLRRLPLLGLFVCVSVFMIARSARAQELYDFKQLAAEAAGAIEKASAGSTHTTVVVTDFEEPHDPDSELAVILAQNFAQALREQARNFTVLDHGDIETAIANHKLPIGALSNRSIVACYYAPENMVLDLGIEPPTEGDGIGGKRIITPLTPAMETLKSNPAVGTQAIFEEDKTVWVRDENSKTTIPAAVSGKGGYSYPECIHCGQAQFTNAAVRAKVSGTVTLSAVIGANGKAQRISVQRALPCGLDQRAIEAIKDWEFRPATGPDGKPAAVVQTVEVTFHQY